MGQRQLNSKLDELLHEVEKTLPRKSSRVIRASEQARLTIDDVLAKHAGSDGRIPRNRQARVLSDLQRVEGEIYRSVQRELQSEFTGTAQQTSAALGAAVFTSLNVASLLAFINTTTKAGELGANAAYLLFELLTRKTQESFAEDLAKTPFSRKDDDGKRLNDRLRDVARLLFREVSDTLRKSIRNGEVTSDMVPGIKQAFKSFGSRLKLIVETEVLYLMRNGIATFAELSGIASGLKIRDYPHGKPSEHRRHKCYIYAHKDEYGLGMGVYPVGTRKIRNPHPKCRSTLHIVLREGVR